MEVLGGKEGRTVDGPNRVGCNSCWINCKAEQVGNWWKEAWARLAEVGQFTLLHCNFCKAVSSTHTLGSRTGPEWGRS